MWRGTWLASLILLSGCGVTGAVDCSAWRPILVGRDDVLTRETAAAILAHDETGRRLCGW
ncbi:hypothetical protein EOD42_23175 [Rhodovarius crocodyli]|uniref:Uncharacterized protein n=1 Tax=Rhodovarius crocodyli TaxID=1979269 RepID=A0A437LZD3_9PROT|nr:hypothetical protein EOD42_23175 [Rhodovarius crocodyli]